MPSDAAKSPQAADRKDAKAAAPILEVEDIEVVYDRIILVLKGVSLTVPDGAMVALLGANGAGKSTTLKAISNLLSLDRGSITRGTIRYRGKEVQRRSPEWLVGQGIVQVLEGRRCFPHLTVEENLLVGAYKQGYRKEAIRRSIDIVYSYFPNLAERRKSSAGYVSGGEQQMLAIGRALLAQPKLLLLDEPSMGLAPRVVSEIFAILSRLNRELGLSVLLAEQNAIIALRHAHYGYVLGNGSVAMDGRASDLSEMADIKQFYLGIGEHEPESRGTGGRQARENSWMI